MNIFKSFLILVFLFKYLGAEAQHGIGTNDPHPDAVLDINATDKGVLLPRVQLTDISVLAPVTGTASDAHNGMIVYNTNSSMTAGLSGEGYYYWNGGATGKWNAVTSTNVSPSIGDVLRWDGNNWTTTPTNPHQTYFSIWAEENGNLGNNNFEWAYGNGDDTPVTQGIAVPINCELVAIGVSLVSASNTTINVLVNGNAVATSNAFSGTGSDVTLLTTPVNISEGDLINFQTLVGGASDGKVVAWFRAGSVKGFHIEELLNVNFASPPSEHDILRWDGTQWHPTEPAGVIVDILDNFSDVETSNVPNFGGELLQWDGSNWISNEINASARISNAQINNYNNSVTFVNRDLENVDYNGFKSSVSTNGTGFTINTAGTYLITYSGQFIASGTQGRNTTMLQINAGGDLGGHDFAYIRNGGVNVNQGSASGSFVAQLSVNDNVRLQSRREGSTTDRVDPDGIGSVNMTIRRLR